MDLAEKGDNLNVDITMKDVEKEGKTNDKKSDERGLYGKIKDFLTRPLLLWGKAFETDQCMSEF